MESNGESAQAFISYQESVHGRAIANGSQRAAVCTDCHGAHEILPANDAKSPISKFTVAQTCGKCHADVANTFNVSIHGQAIGARQRACADVHGLPRHSLHQGAYRSQLAGRGAECFARYLRALPRGRAAVAGVRRARQPRDQLFRQLSRAGCGGRLGGGGQLLQLPRRARHSAFERSAIDRSIAPISTPPAASATRA